MREFRMGLIQTPDQLRFSYMAVIEGARLILSDNTEAQVDVSRPHLFGGKKSVLFRLVVRISPHK